MLSVFIPTTPNPTSGWYAIIPESDVVNVSISIEDAFKVLISGGIVNLNKETNSELPNLSNLTNYHKTVVKTNSDDSDKQI